VRSIRELNSLCTISLKYRIIKATPTHGATQTQNRKLFSLFDRSANCVCDADELENLVSQCYMTKGGVFYFSVVHLFHTSTHNPMQAKLHTKNSIVNVESTKNLTPRRDSNSRSPDPMLETMTTTPSRRVLPRYLCRCAILVKKLVFFQLLLNALP
jgi:hypothetical protein